MPTAGPYGVDAAFMSFQQHERDIHAESPGTGDASVTEVRFYPPARHTATTS
jgi:hypothetical protein